MKYLYFMEETDGAFDAAMTLFVVQFLLSKGLALLPLPQHLRCTLTTC